ncbi:Sporulation initiation phosphotransferase B [compost metagenome]
MKQGIGMRMGIALVGVGWLGMILSGIWPIRLLFGLIMIASAYYVYRQQAIFNQDKLKCELNKQLHESHLEMLQTINHLRHDWMNDIQVLFGYIQLKKLDQLTPYMDKIKMKMQQEGLLSKLGVPSLVAYLLAFRVHSRSMQLEVELDQEINLKLLPLDSKLAAALVQDTIEMFKAHSIGDMQDEPGLLSLELDMEEDHLLLDFVYQGVYNREGLEEVIIRRLLQDSEGFMVEEHDFREEEAVLALRLPYRT